MGTTSINALAQIDAENQNLRELVYSLNETVIKHESQIEALEPKLYNQDTDTWDWINSKPNELTAIIEKTITLDSDSILLLTANGSINCENSDGNEKYISDAYIGFWIGENRVSGTRDEPFNNWHKYCNNSRPSDASQPWEAGGVQQMAWVKSNPAQEHVIRLMMLANVPEERMGKDTWRIYGMGMQIVVLPIPPSIN